MFNIIFCFSVYVLPKWARSNVSLIKNQDTGPNVNVYSLINSLIHSLFWKGNSDQAMQYEKHAISLKRQNDEWGLLVKNLKNVLFGL